ncbi:hypothetical protein H6G00_01665 [Leptolyngbya sp. FACHB-541]|uniref:hypothetical protein n=1 Tax=Leptolyngbya sp. FACHB-541 TaxID=2692810 RepID=UPI001687ECC0|nr:hypothetical protein [Leptolyngbya sp. FACHB-541]MBD1995338.1 hypothetical protein [Leptolyngbya sp. FACHB-541]
MQVSPMLPTVRSPISINLHSEPEDVVGLLWAALHKIYEDSYGLEVPDTVLLTPSSLKWMDECAVFPGKKELGVSLARGLYELHPSVQLLASSPLLERAGSRENDVLIVYNSRRERMKDPTKLEWLFDGVLYAPKSALVVELWQQDAKFPFS